MTAADTFLSEAEKFSTNEVQPAASEWSLGRSPAETLYKNASELGLTSIEVPSEYGGRGFDFRTKAAACGLLAQADFGFSMSLVNTHNVALRLCLSAPAALRDLFVPRLMSGEAHACTALTEPTAGSDFAAIHTTAEKTTAGWVLNGEKTWIVNGRHADVAIVFAQCETVGDSKGIAAFVVDLTAEGVQRYPIESGFSQTSIATGGFRLRNVEMSNDCCILEQGRAFKSILSEINGARSYVASMCNAMLSMALVQVNQYGHERNAFGSTLQQNPGWLRLIDGAESDLQASEALTASACSAVNESAGNAQLAAINAKLKAVDVCQFHLPRLLHAMGAEGLKPSWCFTRHIAATQMAALTDGANNLLRDRADKLTKNTSRT